MVYYVGIRTYIAVKSRDEAERVARKSAEDAAGRVWIESHDSASGREHSSRLPPDAVAAEIERLDPRFQLTSEQQRRRDAALTLADPETWRKITASCIEPTLCSYQAGELTFEDALDRIDRISVACPHQVRMQLLGTMAYLARRVSRRERMARRPPYPECVRTGTADLVLSLKVESPTARVTPGASNRAGRYDRSSPLIRKALDILATLDWFGPTGPPSPATVDDWVRSRQKEAGEKLQKGRPRTRR
jgi:hypothetical protein